MLRSDTALTRLQTPWPTEVWLRVLVAHNPLTNVYGAARSLIALAALLTLALNPLDNLFVRTSAGTASMKCEGFTATSLYCVAPSLELGRIIAVLVLSLVLVGISPRWTAVPFWWVLLSYQQSASTIEGGDQVASIVALLIIVPSIIDGRWNHWLPGGSKLADTETGRLLALSFLFMVRLQASIIYLVAGVAKVAETDWQNGTALYYWMGHPVFGAPGWLQPFLTPIQQSATILALLSWGTIAFEIALAFMLFATARVRLVILPLAVVFHLGIALTMGLTSFSMVMIALNIVSLHPWDSPLRRPKLFSTWRPKIRLSRRGA